jgi:hypothetical protein
VFLSVLSWLSLALLGRREPRHWCRAHRVDQPEPLAGSSLEGFLTRLVIMACTTSLPCINPTRYSATVTV